MADDVNLGQVTGVWIYDTEPPNKNVIWIKTINLLTSEKAGFIWNGMEWINIQGEGFSFKGVFNLAVDYKKRDIVLFNNSLFIKNTNVVNNTDNPNINPDFEIFLPSPAILEETLQATIKNETTTESTHYVSARRFWNGLTRLRAIQNIWTALQTFNSINTKQIYTTKQTFSLVGASPTQVINLDNGSYILLNLTGASGTVTLTLSNGKVGGSYFIQVIQAATKVDISLANEGRFDGLTGSTIVGENNKNYCIVPFFTGTGYLLNIAQLT